MLNSAFHIWHNGHFGTINGFRLGRLPSVSVDWNEINAGLGKAVLLLHCLGKKCKLNLLTIALFLTATIRMSRRASSPQHSVNTNIRRYKVRLRTCSIPSCVNQFKFALECTDQQMSLPYKIEKDKIGSEESRFYSIRRQLNSDEHWTKSLKFMLTDLRWGLTILAANPEL